MWLVFQKSRNSACCNAGVRELDYLRNSLEQGWEREAGISNVHPHLNCRKEGEPSVRFHSGLLEELQPRFHIREEIDHEPGALERAGIGKIVRNRGSLRRSRWKSVKFYLTKQTFVIILYPETWTQQGDSGEWGSGKSGGSIIRPVVFFTQKDN